MVIFFARFAERYLERNGGPRRMLGGAIVTTAVVAGMAWAVRGRSSTVFGPSEWRGPKDRAEIALTFDDGPTPSTPDLFVRSRISGFPPPSSNAACTCEGFPRLRGRSSQQVTKWGITLTLMHGCVSDRRSSYTMSSSARRTASRRSRERLRLVPCSVRSPLVWCKKSAATHRTQTRDVVDPRTGLEARSGRGSRTAHSGATTARSSVYMMLARAGPIPTSETPSKP